MIITKENYFSKEANKKYMSNSQYKGFLECEAKEMAKINGDWQSLSSPAMMQGNYVHAWNESKLDEFKARNPQLFKKDGKLYAQYEICDKVINIIKEDPLFMKALSGQKEVVFTANFFGLDWKILIDSYFPEQKRFGDLKVLKSLDDKFWNKEMQKYLNVFEQYGYFTQMAIYSQVEKIANNRNEYFEPFIAVVTKETYPDKAIISFNSTLESHAEFIDRELFIIEQNIERIKNVKYGKTKAIRCDNCDYCKFTKKLTGTVHYSNFEI